MEGPPDWLARIDACCQFFGVRDQDEWLLRYGSLIHSTDFRSSVAFEGDVEAISAWLRRCEVSVLDADVGPWSPGALGDVLPRVRRLTKVRGPAQFLPQLAELLGSAGVLVALVRPPRRASISGAVWQDRDGRRVLALTGRHLSDDHLWFTVMHEIGHLILHQEQKSFIDQIDDGAGPSDGREAEANDFAASALLPDAARQMLKGRRVGTQDVLRLSIEHGVSPGVVVGLLQHDEVIGYHQLNGLKRRYRWVAGALTAK